MTHEFIRRDPVTFEISKNSLYAITEEMKNVIIRAAFSSTLNLSSDLSCAIADGDGNLVAQGNDIPVHLGAMLQTVHGFLRHLDCAGFAAGDLYIGNDPYEGGTHLPDVSLLMPILVDRHLLGYAVTRVHWADIGGQVPGSSSVTDEILKEGLRIPPICLVKEGRVNRDIVELIKANTRIPWEREGDLFAQISGTRRGDSRVRSLVGKYGWEVVRDTIYATQDYSESMVRGALNRMPDGEYQHEESLDGDGYSDDASQFRVRLKIVKRGDSITFDFTGSANAARGPINAPLAVTASSVYYACLALLGGGIPPNAGCYRPIKIIAPEGSLVNARYPVPVVAANTETSNRLVDIVFQALSDVVPEHLIAGSYGSAGVVTLSVDQGTPTIQYETVGGGMGAGRGMDGLHGIRVHMGNTMNIPIEAAEQKLGITVDAYELIDGSGGAGRWTGGCGVRKVYRAGSAPLTGAVLVERTLTPAPGIAGGLPGRRARVIIRRANGASAEVGGKLKAFRLEPGDALIIETAGGGGYGRSAQKPKEDKAP